MIFPQYLRNLHNLRGEGGGGGVLLIHIKTKLEFKTFEFFGGEKCGAFEPKS